jgi:putative DNA primase/helicase
MSKNSTPTQTPNQKNVLTFPAGAAAASSKAQLRDDALTSAGMPAGYTADENGIYELRETKDGDALVTRICTPLVVKGRCRTAGSKKWGRVLALQDPDGTWHDLVIDTQQLTKSASVALAPLYDRGFELAPVEKAAESVMNLLCTWRPEDQYLRFDWLGWTDNSHGAFVLGSGHVIGNALVATDSVSEDLMAAIHTKGTLAAWKKEVAAPCVGNPLLMLAVAHAFTGPLLSVLGQNGGGFHLRGLSSKGKSTIQYAATSVWGERSLLQSWDGTPSGFEGIAAACNDTLLNIEELHKADPKMVGDIVYMLSNGQGRLRAKSNGKLQRPQRWRVPILSSGEVSLEEHMASAGRKMFAGQDVRLINLEADSRAEGAFDVLHGSENSKVFAERVDRACLENYGHAGPLFVEKLMRNIDKAGNWRAYIDSFCRVYGKLADVSPSDGQVQRVLKRFALAALAGEVATQMGLTGWPKGAARDAAGEMFLTWFEDRDGTTNKEIETAVQRTKDYVSKHLDRFQTIDTTDHDPVDGWRDENWFYVRAERWQAIHAEHAPVEMARLHADGGLMKTQKGNGYQVRMGRNIPGRPRVYAVHAAKLLGAATASPLT